VSWPEHVQPDGSPVRPPQFHPPEPQPVNPPVDDKGVPAAVLDDNPATMDQVMEDLGVSGLGGILRPTEYENQPLRRLPK
jgi:hypothetical protein